MNDFAFEYINSSPTHIQQGNAVKKENILVKNEPGELKCGEIFAAFNGNFTLICGFCNEKFEDMFGFCAHVRTTHEDDLHGIEDDLHGIEDYHKSKCEDNLSVTKTEAGEAVDDPMMTLHSFEDAFELKSDLESDDKNCIFQSNTPEDHENNETHSCDTCGQRFPSSVSLNDHFTKAKCKQVSGQHQNDALKNHLKKRRPRKKATKSKCMDEFSDDLPLVEIRDSLKESKKVADGIENRKMYPCGFCDRVFKSKQSLTCHQARGHNHANQATDLNADDPSYLRCKYCNQEFSTRDECINHEQTHTEDKPYLCWHCNLPFKTSSGRKRHVRIHIDQRPFQCEDCPKGYDNKEQLESHANTHKNPRKFTCNTCGESFFRRYQLGLHEQRRHTGFRPLVCEDCGKSFVTLGELTQHRIRHSDVKDWKCEVCGKCFYSKWALKDHMAGHSDAKPFGCEVCGRWFSRPKALKKHKKLHSDVKAYVCNICGKAYAQDSGLYAHKKTHGIRSKQ